MYFILPLLVWVVITIVVFTIVNQYIKTGQSMMKPPQLPKEVIPHRYTKGTLNTKHQDILNSTHNVIRHEIPEQGYVILNGIKRRIHDCKDL